MGDTKTSKHRKADDNTPHVAEARETSARAASSKGRTTEARSSTESCTWSWSSCRSGYGTRAARSASCSKGVTAPARAGPSRPSRRGSVRAYSETVALPAPTEREKSQMYVQRYLPHLPAGGEVVIFDRSWYNRAGVERVMGFCTEDQAKRFLDSVPGVEKAMVEFRYHPAQILAGGQPRRADQAARSPHR